ncbi:MAG: penicillin acylase family protein [Actinomycetota bacterium]|nr:penicillin acylase family protein [Actinomycetota bacterium]
MSGPALSPGISFVEAFGRAARPIFRRLLRATLPTLDGTVELAGLEGPVEVLRDRFGVPQVFAEYERDLFFGQGYATAQDRFFQMELGRRAGHGRLAELTGESALEFDRLSRAVCLGRIAANAEKDASPEIRSILDAYSAGINAFLTTEPLPPELRLLLARPEPWKPADTAAWSAVLSWSLSASWESDLLNGDIGKHFGDGLRAHIDPGSGPAKGSNAWAVSPERSASGSAMLAGDPHLLLGIPCLWYEVGLYCGRYSVVGASLPGTPGVVIGHNEDIAWSVTAALTDVQDLYVERFEKDNPRFYEHAGKQREAEVREEEIPVRGRREPATLKVRTTLHGPVITDAIEGSGRDLALRYVAPEPLKLVAAGLAVNRARDKDEFLDALETWTVPNQNFVYADRTGVVGKALAGPVPLRKNHEGDHPVPGWDGEHEWVGFMSFEDLPRSFNPAEGYVASANEMPEAGPVPIPGNYLPGYRKSRIEALIQATSKHTLESFRAMQSDLYCAPAHTLAGQLAKLDPPTKAPVGLQRELASWDGHLLAESRPGAVARVALEVLLQQAMGDVGRVASSLPTGAESYFTNLLPKLMQQLAGLSEEYFREALEEAVEILDESLGPDPRGWSWGALHTAKLQHPLGIAGPLRGLLNRGPYPLGGDSNTIWLGAFRSGIPEGSGQPSFDPVTTGPNYRFIVHTGDWDQAWSVISPGQSGHPASANYDDQIELWQNVRYRPMIFGRPTAELAAKHQLVLKPEG